MNQPDPVPPVPSNFGPRYVAWWLWCNAITILQSAQGVFAGLALASDMFSHNTVRVYMVTNAVLSIIIAQVKKNNPPSPPPTKGNP